LYFQVSTNLTRFFKKFQDYFCRNQGRRQKNFQEEKGQKKKQDQKVVPLSSPLLYQYHVWKSGEAAAPLLPSADDYGPNTDIENEYSAYTTMNNE